MSELSELKVKNLKTFLPIETLKSRKPSKEELKALAQDEAAILLQKRTALEIWVASCQMQDYISEIAESVKPQAIEQAISNLPEKGKTITFDNIKVTVAGGTTKEVYDFTVSPEWQKLNTMLAEAEKQVKEIKARIKALEMTLALELTPQLQPDKPSLRLSY
jgi:hypothetical protein